jgi:hypothetical protein
MRLTGPWSLASGRAPAAPLQGPLQQPRAHLRRRSRHALRHSSCPASTWVSPASHTSPALCSCAIHGCVHLLLTALFLPTPPTRSTEIRFPGDAAECAVLEAVQATAVLETQQTSPGSPSPVVHARVPLTREDNFFSITTTWGRIAREQATALQHMASSTGRVSESA